MIIVDGSIIKILFRVEGGKCTLRINSVDAYETIPQRTGMKVDHLKIFLILIKPDFLKGEFNVH